MTDINCNCNLDLDSPNKFIQYELWKDCRNNCTFCFNKGQPNINKIDSLNRVIELVQSEEADAYNQFGIIGGEFFDNQLDDPEVYKLFYKLIDIFIDKYNKEKLEKLYITTSLLFNIDTYLIPFLNYLKNKGIIEYTLLCTSWDTLGRFHTEELKKLWEDNMLRLHSLYPELRLHTETIVTQAFIDSVLNDSFSITEFSKKFNTRMDYIEPGSGLLYYDKKEASEHLPKFFPTKKSFIKFLYKVTKNNEIELSTFLSAYIRSDVIYNILDGKYTHIHGRRKADNGCVWKELKVKYERGFIDSDEKMTDVIEEFKRISGLE